METQQFRTHDDALKAAKERGWEAKQVVVPTWIASNEHGLASYEYLLLY